MSFQWGNTAASVPGHFMKENAYKVCYRREKGRSYEKEL